MELTEQQLVLLERYGLAIAERDQVVTDLMAVEAERDRLITEREELEDAAAEALYAYRQSLRDTPC